MKSRTALLACLFAAGCGGSINNQAPAQSHQNADAGAPHVTADVPSALPAPLFTPIPTQPAPAPTAPHLVTLDHPHWSITVSSGFTVKSDADDGMEAEIQGNDGFVHIQVLTSDLEPTVDPKAFAIMSTMLAPSLVPEGFQVLKSDNELKTMKKDGTPYGVTMFLLSQNVFMGVVGLEQASTHTGYLIPCACTATPEPEELCAKVTNSFKLK